MSECSTPYRTSARESETSLRPLFLSRKVGSHVHENEEVAIDPQAPREKVGTVCRRRRRGRLAQRSRHRDGRAFACAQSEQFAWGRSAWLIFIRYVVGGHGIGLLANLIIDLIAGNAGDGKTRMVIARRCLAVSHRPIKKLPQFVDGLTQ